MKWLEIRAVWMCYTRIFNGYNDTSIYYEGRKKVGRKVRKMMKRKITYNSQSAKHQAKNVCRITKASKDVEWGTEREILWTVIINVKDFCFINLPFLLNWTSWLYACCTCKEVNNKSLTCSKIFLLRLVLYFSA